MSRTQTIFVYIALAVFVTLVVRTFRQEAKDKAARREKMFGTPELREVFRQKVLQMAFKHGADLNSLEILSKWNAYTLEIQQALLDPDKRSHILLAPVVDVQKLGNEYFLTAHDSSTDIYFQLRCDAKQLQYIMSSHAEKRGRYDDYAIVMIPESVHKPVAQLTAEDGGGDIYVFHEAADIVIVKGRCIDILSLENSRLKAKHLLLPKSKEKP